MAFYARIHHDKRFVAVFSPKCGCTTVKNWFKSALDVDGPTERYITLRHGIPVGDAGKYRSYRRIFFIRNPFLRLVSFYAGFVIRETPQWCFADDAGRHRLEGRTFAQLVDTLALLHRDSEPFQHHLQPQLGGVETLEFDTVIPIESFDTEIGPLSEELGIAYEPRRLNATPYDKNASRFAYHRPPQEMACAGVPEAAWFYNGELADIVSSLYRGDIEYYDRHRRS